MKFHFSAHIFTITVNFNQNIVRTNSRRKAQVFSIHCFQLSLFHENLTFHSTCHICSGSILDLRLSVVLATHIRQTRINLCPTKRREYIYILDELIWKSPRIYLIGTIILLMNNREQCVVVCQATPTKNISYIVYVCVCVVVHVWVVSFQYKYTYSAHKTQQWKIIQKINKWIYSGLFILSIILKLYWFYWKTQYSYGTPCIFLAHRKSICILFFSPVRNGYLTNVFRTKNIPISW